MIGDSILHAYELVMSGIDMKDTDQDGIYDIIEKKGFRISNGQIIKTIASKKDSDGDGVNDFDELNASRIYTYQNNGAKYFTFCNYSNPVLVDSDGDGYSDGYEEVIIGNFDLSKKEMRLNETVFRKKDNKPMNNETIRGFKDLILLTRKYGKIKGIGKVECYSWNNQSGYSQYAHATCS